VASLHPGRLRNIKARRHAHRGALIVLFALVLVVLLLVTAFALDLGMLYVAKTELQRSADAAALAGTEELLKQTSRRLEAGSGFENAETDSVRQAAISFAEQNAVIRQAPDLQRNDGNANPGEIVLGELPLGASALTFDDPSRFNSVKITAKRTADRNGEVPLYFGQMFGLSSSAVVARSQAVFLQDFKGFRIPEGDPPPTLMVLPFVLEANSWRAAQNGTGPDNYKVDPDSGAIQPGRDGIRELELFPLDTGAGGNFGTVDLGSDNSNTPTLRRQITDGLTREDLAFHGGELALNDRGQLHLSGDPGLKAGAIEPELRKIIGQKRIIMLYDSVQASGNRADFTIVGFAGVKLLDVQLTTADKYIRVQAAPMIVRGGIPGKGSSQIFSPVKLIEFSE
jgi:Flp pilus assembly protein TadG